MRGGANGGNWACWRITVAMNVIEMVGAVAERFIEEADAFEIRKTTVKNIDALIKLNLVRLN
jgi:hypothetical protein